jgi:hypothetical protein
MHEMESISLGYPFTCANVQNSTRRNTYWDSIQTLPVALRVLIDRVQNQIQDELQKKLEFGSKFRMQTSLHSPSCGEERNTERDAFASQFPFRCPPEGRDAAQSARSNGTERTATAKESGIALVRATEGSGAVSAAEEGEHSNSRKAEVSPRVQSRNAIH